MGNCESCNENEKAIQDVYKTQSNPQIYTPQIDDRLEYPIQSSSFDDGIKTPPINYSPAPEKIEITKSNSGLHNEKIILADGSQYEGKVN